MWSTLDAYANVMEHEEMMAKLFKIICLYLVTTLSSAYAEDTNFQATYDMVWKGIRVFSADLGGTVNSKTYDLDASIRPRGIAALFVDGHSKITSSGTLDNDGGVKAVDYNVSGMWDDEESYRKITFDPKGRVTHMEVRLPEEWTKDEPLLPIPDDLRAGPDPMSLMVAIMRQPWQRDDYTKPYVIATIDGESVMEYTMNCDADQSQIKLKKSRSPFHGQATRCTVDMKRLAGFLDESRLTEKQLKKLNKRRAKHEKAEAKMKRKGKVQDPPLELWFQNLEGSDMMVPVRAKLRADRGSVSIYLSSYETGETAAP